MNDRDPVCVAHGCMQQRHFTSIRELQAKIAKQEALLRELRNEIIPHWSKREAITAINELLGEDDE